MFDACPPLAAPSLHQSAQYADALRLFGAQTNRLADGTLVLRRKVNRVPIAMLPRARLHPDTLRGLVKTAGLNNAVWLLNPDHPAPWLADLGAVAVMTPAHIAELPLTGDLRAQMHQKWRNRLTFAERQGLRVTRQNLPDKPDQWLLEQDRKQQKSRSYSTWPEALTLTYARANKGDAKLFIAFDGAAPVAAMLILRHGQSATYHVSHTTDDGRKKCAHNLLMWEAMQWLAAKGVTTLDLGQVDTEKAAGLARFKLGTGARLRPLGGTWLWWPPLGKTLKPLKYLTSM
ncbi:MAG: GNAT family N-acetyltransferase [Shimia sp.]|nr:GNAT family N-acetyltransferase [Shimia sp.]